MERVLYFIGHYDYLLPAMLIQSGLNNKNIEADFVVLETRNHEEVINFLHKKQSEKSTIGRIAVVDDINYLNKRSEAETLMAVNAYYFMLFKQLRTKITDYSHIYISFDEWNSFGIYLQKFVQLPDVTVIVKHVRQMDMNIYHYLDAPDKFHFSNLQKKYRVLNADASYVKDVITLTNEMWGGCCSGKPVSYFDTQDTLMNIDEEQFEKLCSFFEFNPADYVGEKDLLLLDAYWFGNEYDNLQFNYIRPYQLFLDYLNEPRGLVVKENARYCLPENIHKGYFKAEKVIKGWIPEELLIRASELKIVRALSIGNSAAECIRTRAKEVICLNNAFFFQYRNITRLEYAILAAIKLGQNILPCNGIHLGELDEFNRLLFKQDIIFADIEKMQDSNHTFSLYSNMDCFTTENLLERINNGEIIAVLDTEKSAYCFSLEDYNTIKEFIYPVKLAKKKVNSQARYDVYEEKVWIFAKDLPKELIDKSLIRNHKVSGYTAKPAYSLLSRACARRLPEKCETRHYISMAARGKRVIIYGSTEIARNYLKKYGNSLDVRCIMRDPDEEVDDALANDYQVVLFDKNIIHPDDYVIICKSFVHNIDKIPDYALARDNMLRMGFKTLQDFVYYRLAEAVEEKKEVMLFCGYCELSGIKQILDLTSFTNDYCMIFYHIGRETMKEAPGFDDFVATAKLCDVLVHAPLIVKRGTLDVDVMNLVSSRTKTVLIPQLTFKGYAPYKNTNYLRRNYRLKLFGTCYYPFLYEVPYLNKWIKDGKSDAEIIKLALSDDLFSKEEIVKNAAVSLRMIQIMERKSDIPMYDFIEKNYKDKYLFKDCIHANDVMFFEYARRFSKFIGKDIISEIDNVEKTCEENGVFFQVATEEPVLPCVAKALNLSFATSNRRYMEKITEENIRLRTLKQWIKDYCGYYRAVLNVKRTLNPTYGSEKVTIWRNEENIYNIYDGEN